MSSHRQPQLTARLQGFGTTIFTEMTRLAEAHDAINLGQGFPDSDPPAHVTQAAVDAINAGKNQYAPGNGVRSLREAVAAHQHRFWGLEFDPEREVTVSAGATEGMCATVQAVCETGDEVVLLEPAYDAHRAAVAMAGATVKPVVLRAPDYRIDPDELAAAVSQKTRAIVVNSPHNPTGTVYTRADLERVATLCVDRDLLAITDEVYEHLVYEGEHIPLATLPGMRERTVTVSSAAKTFSATGWKVGWVCASPPLTAAVRTAKQFMTFTNATPFQHAIAAGLDDDEHLTGLREDYGRRHRRLAEGLAQAGLQVHPAAGSYFVTADVRPLGIPDDVEFCRMLPEKAGVAAVPVSNFYTDARDGRGLVRFACCKRDEVIDAGVERLKQLLPDVPPASRAGGRVT